jgi:alpha/beta hydrolase fold
MGTRVGWRQSTSERCKSPMWKEHVLPTADLQLAWYEAGDGPAVVFLHGGPGDDHSYLRPLAEPLSRQFRCILYDQRGSGHSHLRELHGETLHITRFFDDLEALRLHLAQPLCWLPGTSVRKTGRVLRTDMPSSQHTFPPFGRVPPRSDLATSCWKAQCWLVLAFYEDDGSRVTGCGHVWCLSDGKPPLWWLLGLSVLK